MPRKSFPAALKAAFPHTVPILTGYLAVGLAYGLLMASKGYNFLWSGFVSAFAFCGSMQYVAITLLTTAFDPLSAFFLSLMVNARHLFFALALLPKYRGLGKLRYFLIYTLSDETFSIVSSVEPPEDVPRKDFYLAVSLLNYGYWAAGSVLGAVAGGVIGHQFGGGHGRSVATVVGALGGGYAGNQLQGAMQDNDTYTTTQQRCKTVYDKSDKMLGYDVTYKIGGQQGKIRMEHDPGTQIPLDSNGQLILNNKA